MERVGWFAHLNATAKPTSVASFTESPVPVQNLTCAGVGGGLNSISTTPPTALGGTTPDTAYWFGREMEKPDWQAKSVA